MRPAFLLLFIAFAAVCTALTAATASFVLSSFHDAYNGYDDTYQNRTDDNVV